MKFIKLLFVLFFLIGCGGGGGSGSGSNTSTASSDGVTISAMQNAEPTINQNSVAGKLYVDVSKPTLNENTDYKVLIKSFNVTTDKCEIKDAKINNSYSNIDITNISELDYQITLEDNCIPSNINMDFDIEKIYTYKDVGSSQTETLSKTVTLALYGNTENPSIDPSLIVTDPQSITIQNSNESSSINIWVYDKKNKPISGATINISPLVDNGIMFGSVDKTALTTDQNGKVTITYTSPSDLSSLYGKTEYLTITCNDLNKTIPLIFQTPNKVSKIILSDSNIIVTPNMSKKINIITLDASNKPIQSTVNISVPLDNNNNSLGSFDKYSVTTDENGNAEVTYTAPSTFPQNDINTTVTFSSGDVSSELTLIFKTTQNTNTYKIKENVENSYSVDEEGTFQIAVVNSASENDYLNQQNILEISLKALSNMIIFENNSSQITFKNNLNNPFAVKFKTKTSAGVENIEATVKIINNNTEQNITKTFPITILGGKIHTISIFYSGNKKNNDATFTDTYTVLATDKYGNPAKPGSKIYVSAINIPKKDANQNYLYLTDAGKIYSENSVVNFETNQSDFSNVDTNDHLIVLASPNRLDGSYLGSWSIKEIVSNTKLLLDSNYVFTNPIDGLTFTIGNEKRYNSCDYTTVNILFKDPTGVYEIDNNGELKLELTYPYYMVGKTVVLGVVSDNGDNRVGTSIKKILRGSGIEAQENVECTGGQASSKTCSNLKMHFVIDDYSIKNTSFTHFEWTDSKTMQGCSYTITNDNTQCNGYMEFSITAPAGVTCTLHWMGGVKYEY